MIGGTLVFTGAVTAYITPAVLGGSKVLMLETLLYQPRLGSERLRLRERHRGHPHCDERGDQRSCSNAPAAARKR